MTKVEAVCLKSPLCFGQSYGMSREYTPAAMMAGITQEIPNSLSSSNRAIATSMGDAQTSFMS